MKPNVSTLGWEMPSPPGEGVPVVDGTRVTARGAGWIWGLAVGMQWLTSGCSIWCLRLRGLVAAPGRICQDHGGADSTCPVSVQVLQHSGSIPVPGYWGEHLWVAKCGNPRLGPNLGLEG